MHVPLNFFLKCIISFIEIYAQDIFEKVKFTFFPPSLVINQNAVRKKRLLRASVPLINSSHLMMKD